MTPHLRTTVLASVTLGLTLALAGRVLAAPAQAAGSGRVAGVVRLDGKPVKGLKVHLQQTQDDGDVYESIASDTTDSKGRYSFSGFPAGDAYGYDVLVTDSTQRIVKARRYFTERRGKTVTRNVTVKKAARLTGTVTRADGGSPQSVRVALRGPDDEIGTPDTTILSYDDVVKVGANGTFVAKGLPAGAYDLTFTDTSKSFLDQCYDNVLSAANDSTCGDDGTSAGRTTVQVGAGDTTTLHPQLLSHAANRISGRVTDTSGRPIRGVIVEAVSDGRGPERADGAWEQGVSQTSGNVTIGRFPDGVYRLRVEPASMVWAPQWFDRSTTRAGAKAISVQGGRRVGGIAIKLKSRATIGAALEPGRGRVKVAVHVTRAATGSAPSGTVTVRWGTVFTTVTLVKGRATAKLAGLPKGKRRITLTYSGTPSTAGSSRVLHTTVR